MKKISTPVLGWATCVYSSKRNYYDMLPKVYKSCLSVYKCEICDFIETPRQPVMKKSKFSAPRKPNGYCPNHGCSQVDLVHYPCLATVTFIPGESYWKMEHKGNHNHPKAPRDKVTASAMKKLETVVKAAPSIGPRSLKLGSFSQQLAADIHPALNNQGCLAYLKRKVLKETGMKSTIGSLEW